MVILNLSLFLLLLSNSFLIISYKLIYSLLAEILLLDGETVVFRSGTDCKFYISGSTEEVCSINVFLLYLLSNICIFIPHSFIYLPYDCFSHASSIYLRRMSSYW